MPNPFVLAEMEMTREGRKTSDKNYVSMWINRAVKIRNYLMKVQAKKGK